MATPEKENPFTASPPPPQQPPIGYMPGPSNSAAPGVQPMPGYAYAAQPVVYQAPAMTISQALSPAEIKKLRKMTWINFGCTMLQLGVALAFILIIDNNLERYQMPKSGSTIPQYNCLLSSNPNNPGPCRYAYSLASVSIFWGFILSLIQCMTMDCCGMGRLFEMLFDIFATVWWIAGAITLGVYASDADAAGIPAASARHAIVALAWVSAFVFFCLGITNMILMKKLGKAYRGAAQQMQAAGAMGGHHPQFVQMQPHVGPTTPGMVPAGYPGHPQQQPMPGVWPQQQLQQQPMGVPPAGAPVGYPAAAPVPSAGPGPAAGAAGASPYPPGPTSA